MENKKYCALICSCILQSTSIEHISYNTVHSFVSLLKLLDCYMMTYKS